MNESRDVHPLTRDDAGIRALRLQVSALERVLAELRELASTNEDFDTGAALRQRDAEVSEKLEAIRMRLSRARATGVVAAVPASERRARTQALARLDRYIRDDQDLHASITYLMQIASCFK